MYGAKMKDATTGAMRMVQVSAPGTISRIRWTRRCPGLSDAALATCPLG
jgi:hypothetical protein